MSALRKFRRRVARGQAPVPGRGREVHAKLQALLEKWHSANPEAAAWGQAHGLPRVHADLAGAVLAAELQTVGPRKPDPRDDAVDSLNGREPVRQMNSISVVEHSEMCRAWREWQQAHRASVEAAQPRVAAHTASTQAEVDALLGPGAVQFPAQVDR